MLMNLAAAMDCSVLYINGNRKCSLKYYLILANISCFGSLVQPVASLSASVTFPDANTLDTIVAIYAGVICVP